jgi:hypothetical protein
MKQRTVRVCPKCGSPRIREAASSVGGWLVPTTYYCEEENCHYSGPIYVEISVDELEKMRKLINGTDEAK